MNFLDYPSSFLYKPAGVISLLVMIKREKKCTSFCVQASVLIYYMISLYNVPFANYKTFITIHPKFSHRNSKHLKDLHQETVIIETIGSVSASSIA